MQITAYRGKLAGCVRAGASDCEFHAAARDVDAPRREARKTREVYVHERVADERYPMMHVVTIITATLRRRHARRLVSVAPAKAKG